MRMFIRTLFFLFVTFVFTSVHADIDEPTAREVVKRSGLEKQLESIPTILQDMLAQAWRSDQTLQHLPDDDLNRFKSAVATIFEYKNMTNAVIDQLKTEMDDDDAKRIMQWLDSETGKKITEADEKVSTQEGYNEMLSYADELQKQLPPEAYILRIQEIAVATKAIESSVSIAINMQRAIATAAFAASPDSNIDDLPFLFAQLERVRPQIEQKTKQQTILTLLYAYRAISDSDLNKYADFASTQVGQKYHATMIRALDTVYTEASKRLGRELVKLLEGVEKKSAT